jgi:hypothetical protein
MISRTDKVPPESCRMPKNLGMKRKKLIGPASSETQNQGRAIVLLKMNCDAAEEIGDRRLALCALANSAGQPTENLTTSPK